MGNVRGFSVLLATLVVMLSLPSAARPQIPELGDHNAVMSVGLGTIGGALLGLGVGVTLGDAVDDEGIDGDVVRWSYVVGTLGGFLLGVVDASSQPLVDRYGVESPLVTVLKTAFVGYIAGVALGAAGNLIFDDDLEGDDVQWWLGIGSVTGTALGLAVGIYQSGSRSRPGSALFQIKPGQPLTVAVPVPELRFERPAEIRISMLSLGT